MGIAEKLKPTLQLFKQELTVFRLVSKNPKTPRRAKILLGVAIAYLVSPIDLIPDFIPVIGHLDDAIIVPALVYFALKVIPQEVIDDCRRQAQQSTT